MRSVLVFGLLLFTAAPSRVEAQWIEAKSAHYSVFYQNGCRSTCFPLQPATSIRSRAGKISAVHAGMQVSAQGPSTYWHRQRQCGRKWFVQGLQEYDAIFHTTDSNRDLTVKRLLEWARSNPTKFACCSPNLAIADVYNGGAAFMAFLAAQFGEDIHARLLRNTASTFAAALADETKPYSLPVLFARFRKWLDSGRP